MAVRKMIMSFQVLAPINVHSAKTQNTTKVCLVYKHRDLQNEEFNKEYLKRKSSIL
jgi:hypothetical protein